MQYAVSRKSVAEFVCFIDHAIKHLIYLIIAIHKFLIFNRIEISKIL